MSQDIIKKLLGGKVINPVTGKKISIPVEEIHIESGALDKIAEFCKKHELGLRAAIVSDELTHIAAGAEVERNLCRAGFEVFSIVLPSDATADDNNIEMLSRYLATADFSIAVGSGTISDLTKYASFMLKRKYICVPTAPSVNGYSSANASIEVNGVKKSLGAHMPTAIFMDIDVQVQAPHRLIVAGLGDALARSTAQVDWLMSHLILGTEYNPLPFEILQEDEAFVFANADKLPQRDYDTLVSLCRLSILSGLGMYIAGGSHPASQAEHLVHHYMEMMHEGKYPHTYHGEQIAVTSISLAHMQKDILSLTKLEVEPTYYTEKPVMKHFGEERGASFLRELKEKEISPSRANELNTHLRKEWPQIRKQLLAVHIAPEVLEGVVKKIKGPYTYKHLGWNHTDYQNAIRHSLFMRNRFTFLDLAMIAKRQLAA